MSTQTGCVAGTTRLAPVSDSAYVTLSPDDRRELAVDVGRGTRTRGTVLVTSFR